MKQGRSLNYGSLCLHSDQGAKRPPCIQHPAVPRRLRGLSFSLPVCRRAVIVGLAYGLRGNHRPALLSLAAHGTYQPKRRLRAEALYESGA
jgi:hypothetical protein